MGATVWVANIYAGQYDTNYYFNTEDEATSFTKALVHDHAPSALRALVYEYRSPVPITIEEAIPIFLEHEDWWQRYLPSSTVSALKENYL